MQLVFKREWDFMGRRRFFIALSLALIVLSLLSLSMRGLNFGIDFTGGALIEVGYPEAADLGAMRDVLGSAVFEDAQVQNFGTSRDALIRLRPNEELDGATLGETVMNVLSAADPDVSLRRVEFVGPQVGEDLREQGGLAMLFALLLILAYVAFRFQYKFALGALISLGHDVIILLGIFALFLFQIVSGFALYGQYAPGGFWDSVLGWIFPLINSQYLRLGHHGVGGALVDADRRRRGEGLHGVCGEGVVHHRVGAPLPGAVLGEQLLHPRVARPQAPPVGRRSHRHRALSAALRRPPGPAQLSRPCRNRLSGSCYFTRSEMTFPDAFSGMLISRK